MVIDKLSFMSFQSIRKILPQAVRSAGIEKQITAVRVLETTQKVIQRLWGEEKANYLVMISFSAGTLKIRALAPVAAQEIKIATVQIQNEINRELGSKVVHQIHVVV
ncbi:DUF721 domain-containing protein [Candidatus Uhrbacteria bacterium]|nr:DUF721 domain-containing protein [Candidatus Uhrbacteria bacterium]